MPPQPRPIATAYTSMPSKAGAAGYEPLPVDADAAGQLPARAAACVPADDSGPKGEQDAAYVPLPVDVVTGTSRGASAASDVGGSAHAPVPPEGSGTHYEPLATNGETGATSRRKHKKVEVLNSPIGLSTKRVGAEYEGEHNEVGWRQWRMDPKDARVTTRLQSEGEIAANRLVIDEQGAFAKGDGSSVKGETVEYVMDPTTGTMVSFSPSLEVVQQTENGGTVRRPVESPLEARRAIRMDPSARVEVTHHSSALGGEDVLDEQGQPVFDVEGRPVQRSKPVAAAGEVSFNAAGQLIRITNASGHYRPTVGHLIQAVEQLARQGAFFTDEVVDADGRPLAPGSDLARLYEAVQQKRATLPMLAARIEVETARLAGAPDKKGRDRSASEIARVTAEIEAINAAIDVLRRLGVGPSRRLRAEAEVGLIERAEAMTGAEVRGTTEVSNTSVDKFLRTGAGNTQQLQNKAKMHEELLAKRPKTPAVNETGARAAPDATEIAAVLQALAGGEQTVLEQQSDGAPAAPRERGEAPASRSKVKHAPESDYPNPAETIPARNRPDEPPATGAQPEPERGRNRRRLRNLRKQLAQGVTGTFKAVTGGLAPGSRARGRSGRARSKR